MILYRFLGKWYDMIVYQKKMICSMSVPNWSHNSKIIIYDQLSENISPPISAVGRIKSKNPKNSKNFGKIVGVFLVWHNRPQIWNGSWPSSSGLRGHRRTYLTILERAWSANFKMVWYVLLRPIRPELNGQDPFQICGR
jgi:hypothetical protein